jgi:hypothetical protein
MNTRFTRTRVPALALAALVLAACSVLGGSRSVIITWEVQSEQDTAGYNLWRAESAGGPFTQVNLALIPAHGDPVVAHSYTYTDESVVCGTTYWYKLEEVETTGNHNMLNDKVTQVTACR